MLASVGPSVDVAGHSVSDRHWCRLGTSTALDEATFGCGTSSHALDRSAELVRREAGSPCKSAMTEFTHPTRYLPPRPTSDIGICREIVVSLMDQAAPGVDLTGLDVRLAQSACAQSPSGRASASRSDTSWATRRCYTRGRCSTASTRRRRSVRCTCDTASSGHVNAPAPRPTIPLAASRRPPLTVVYQVARR